MCEGQRFEAELCNKIRRVDDLVTLSMYFGNALIVILKIH